MMELFDIVSDPATRNFKNYLSMTRSLATQPSISVKREYTPKNISKSSLPSNGFFVFGSNNKGVHGLGAAKTAVTEFGAIRGQAIGKQGKAFAIRTKMYQNGALTKYNELTEDNKKIMDKMTVQDLNELRIEATTNPNNKYYVTEIGTKLAGRTVDQMKNFFMRMNSKLGIPNNIILPQVFEVRTTQPSTSVEVKNKVGDIVDITFDINGKDVDVKAKILSIEKGNEFYAKNGRIDYYYFVDLENTKTGKKYEFEIDEDGSVSQVLGANGKTMIGSSTVVNIIFDREAIFGKPTQPSTSVDNVKTDIERRRKEALNSIEFLDSDSASGASLYSYKIDGKEFQEMDKWTVKEKINTEYDRQLAGISATINTKANLKRANEEGSLFDIIGLPGDVAEIDMVSDSIKDTQLDLFNQTPLTFGGKSINEQLEIINTPEFKSFFAEETIKNPNLDASEALDYYIKCKGL